MSFVLPAAPLSVQNAAAHTILTYLISREGLFGFSFRNPGTASFLRAAWAACRHTPHHSIVFLRKHVHSCFHSTCPEKISSQQADVQLHHYVTYKEPFRPAEIPQAHLKLKIAF